jgi:two-component system, chemotaxis family, protein-glutamate methylesterase/glutaminase
MEKNEITAHTTLLLMGGSAGSLEVVLQLVPELPKKLQIPIIIIFHRKQSDSILTSLLEQKTSLPVFEVEDKTLIKNGWIYLAPPDYHLLVEKNGTLSLDFSEKIHFSRPSIDVSFETAADAYGPGVTALLFSGANGDGTTGLKKIKEKGGITIAQDPGEASVNYMPLHAIQNKAADFIMTMEEMKLLMRSLPSGDHQTLRGQVSP